MINEKLEALELKGRSRFEKLLKFLNITNYSFSPLTCVYDCELVTDAGNSYIVEIKHRDNKYAAYPDLLLEQNKQISLNKVAKDKECNILYIHSYEDSPIIKIADITGKEFKFKEEWQPKSNIFQKGHINKMICYIKEFKSINIK